MRLNDLVRRAYPSVDVSGLPAVEITGVQDDSRRIEPGDLFVARQGGTSNGADFAPQAATRGAVAVATGASIDNCPLPQVLLPEIMSAAALLSHALYHHPASAMKVLGITGTNGKTTTAYLLRHLLNTTGHKCGMIGTVQSDDGAKTVESSLTTPDPVDVARLMKAMRDNGCDCCAMEVSSHSLDQHRVAGVPFAAGAFTNLTGDHLDYHKTMDDYAAAKARLFEQLPPDAVAVVNGEDAYAARMVLRTQARIVRFALEAGGDYHADDISISAQGSEFLMTTPMGQQRVSMRLIGRYNIENALTAAAIAGEAMGLTTLQIAQGLSTAAGAPGRLQVVPGSGAFSVLVDYAHTDDALENVLRAMRPLTGGKLRVLFGCGGDRDPKKRPRMAEVARRLADAVYITTDNPRGEDPMKIIREVAAGLTDRSAAVIEPDRRTAIRRIIADARKGDVVLLAGKGHETYQLVCGVKHHFDDVEEAAAALSE